MRLPKVTLSSDERAWGHEPPYSATIKAMIWPGLREEIRVTRLARRPDSACCNRLERSPSGRVTYVVTLYSRGQPFASFYLSPDWVRDDFT
ncbi:MAG: hypothetical protein ACP5HK_07145 [Acidilobus sp.]